LTVIPSSKTQRPVSICASETITVGDTTYKTSGVYTKVLKSSQGCDSTIITNLTVVDAKTHNQERSLCKGGKLTVAILFYKLKAITRPA
jgi:hypothetical protein